DGLELLPTPCEAAPRQWRDHPGAVRWHHRSWLDRPGTAVVSCATAALDTSQTTWASLTCVQAPDGAVVRGPRLAVELPIQDIQRFAGATGNHLGAKDR